MWCQSEVYHNVEHAQFVCTTLLVFPFVIFKLTGNLTSTSVFLPSHLGFDLPLIGTNSQTGSPVEKLLLLNAYHNEALGSVQRMLNWNELNLVSVLI